MSPILILIIGILVVIGLIVLFRVHAFFALIIAAMVVSLMSPGEWADKIGRVATAFGGTAGSIGIVIALAAVIGAAMMASGAADRVVRFFLDAFGIKRSGAVLASSGFVLSVPVFFDTVFYLLVPLARSMYRTTKGNYLKYIMAISAGAAATHSLVPPTPGPLVIADNLNVDLGMMIMMGLLVALPAATVAMIYTNWLTRRMEVPFRPLADEETLAPPPPERAPGLLMSLLPIILPVLLITSNTIFSSLADGAGPDSFAAQATQWTGIIGNPNLALLLSAYVALLGFAKAQMPTKDEMQRVIETALMSGGVIILITAGGGAFGAMLQEAQIGPAIQGMFAGSAQSTGITMLFLGFFLAALLKFAQGSSTVAMITASAMMASMIAPESLGIHPVYLGTAIGSGALVGSWMNDSGFWIYAKMGGLTEVEALKSWTPMLIVLGVAGMVMTLILSLIMPLA